MIARLPRDNRLSRPRSMFVRAKLWEQKLLYSSGPASQKIYQYKLRQVCGIGEVSLAIGHGAHLFYEVDQVIIAGQHECVDHYTGFATGLYFLESLGHDERIAAHRVLIKTASRIAARFFNSCAWRSLYETGRRLAVSHHHDLLHLFA